MGRNQPSFIDTNVNGNKSKLRLCEQMKEMFKETNETNDYGGTNGMYLYGKK